MSSVNGDVGREKLTTNVEHAFTLKNLLDLLLNPTYLDTNWYFNLGVTIHVTRSSKLHNIQIGHWES
jgi:hypothetical protein